MTNYRRFMPFLYFLVFLRAIHLYSAGDDSARPTTVAPSVGTATVDDTPMLSSVDCRSISPRAPVNIAQMTSLDGAPPYLVSFSWWDHRLGRDNYKRGRPLQSNPSVQAIQRLLLEDLKDTQDEIIFVDVGANVGFMTNFALALPNHRVFAIDPISYNIAKLCEAYRAMEEKGFLSKTNVTQDDGQPHPRYHLYHAAAGPSYQPNVTITRPSDKVGKFDQASLSRDAVYKEDVEQEYIPLLTVDSLVLPWQQKVGVVKIDVQGNEYGVLQGMRQLLSSPNFFPTYIMYEDDAGMTKKSGYTPGGCQKLLEEQYGYTCKTETKGDVLCEKRKQEEEG